MSFLMYASQIYFVSIQKLAKMKIFNLIQIQDKLGSVRLKKPVECKSDVTNVIF